MIRCVYENKDYGIELLIDDDLPDHNLSVHYGQEQHLHLDRASAAFKLGKALLHAIEAKGLFDPPVPDTLFEERHLQAALAPYKETVIEAMRTFGDKAILQFLAGTPCGCMGPRDDEPLCPCDMRRAAATEVADERGFVIP